MSELPTQADIDLASDIISGKFGNRDYSSRVNASGNAIAAHRTASNTEARRAVIEECAKVADEHASKAWRIAEAEGQNSACASGRNYGGRAIANAIRALAD